MALDPSLRGYRHATARACRRFAAVIRLASDRLASPACRRVSTLVLLSLPDIGGVKRPSLKTEHIEAECREHEHLLGELETRSADTFEL